MLTTFAAALVFFIASYMSSEVTYPKLGSYF
jgi:hypothetical protein